jgi:hypothetical protein
MKQLIQMIGFYLFGVNSVVAIIAAGSLILIVKMFVEKIAESNRQWNTRKRNEEMESDVWAIE